MEIREGYKETEVGVIPIDWDCGELGSITSKIGSGITPIGGSRIYQRTGRPFVRSQNVQYGKMNLVDIAYIDESTHKTFDSTEIQYYDVLLNITGASIGRSSIADIAVVGGNVNQHVCILRPITNVLNSRYLCGYLLSAKGQKYIDDFQAGGNRQGLNFKQIASIKIPIPPLPEQQAIATALSDMDGLISSLIKLIDKKKNIKQGAMQELLTGKKRLDGFSGEWVNCELRELLDYEQPTNYIVMSTDYSDKGIPVLTAGKSFILGYTNENVGIYTKYPVIIFDDFTTTSKYVTFEFKVKSSAMKILRLKNPNYNLRLIFELMQLIEFPLIDHKRYWISEYSKLTIKLPKSIEEQNEITKVISDMDSEIESLEQKLTKYKATKQGMMQELLTGRIRLVEAMH